MSGNTNNTVFLQRLFSSRDNFVSGNVQEATSNTANFVGQAGRIWWDPIRNNFYASDGNTPGGLLIGNVSSGNGVAAGPTNSIQYNAGSGAFGGIANVSINPTNGNLSVTGNVIAGSFYGDGNNLSNLQGANVTGAVAFATTANAVALANVSGAGNVAALNLDGNTSNILYGNGVFASAPAGGGYGNSNVATFLASYGSNTMTTTGNVSVGNIIGNGQALTGLAGANVTGQVANALVAGTVYTNAQPNITSVGTLTSLSVTGNISAGNVSATTFTGALSGAATSATTAGTVTTNAQPNITSVGTLTSLGVSGTVTAAAFTANTGVFTGNGNGLSSITGANVTGAVSFATTANAVAGANVSGAVANATFATTAGSATTAGTVTTAAQPNITSVGTLTDLNVSGNAIIGGNLTVNGNLVYVNVETLAVEDPIIQLQTGPNGAAPVANSGKDVGTGLNYYDTQARVAFMGWDVSNTEFGMASQASITDEVVTFTSYGNLRVGNIIGNGQALTGLAGGNVTGQVGNALVAGTVYTAAQPNITSVGTLTSLGVTGNISSGNANLGNAATANFFIGSGNNLSNIQGANVTGAVATATTAGTVTTAAQPNITSVGTLTSLAVTGNLSSGNANLGNLASANFFQGDGSLLTNIPIGTSLSNGNSNVNIPAANGNVNISAVGNANIVVVTGTGVNVAGTLNATGNANVGNIGATNGVFTNVSGNGSALSSITGANVTGAVAFATTANAVAGANVSGQVSFAATANAVAGANVSGQVANALVAGTVYTNAQPNITSVGTLTSLDVTGNLSSGNANLGNAATANFFIGSGNNLSNIQGANVTGTVATATTAGTVTTAAQPNITSVGTLTSLAVTGNLSSGNANLGNLAIANFFSGDGSLLTNITSAGSSIANGTSNVIISALNGPIIGHVSGTRTLSLQENSVALGANAGLTTQGANTVAIGPGAGMTSQGLKAVAVGQLAGNSSQGQAAVAVGSGSGLTGQGTASIAVGVDAGSGNQGSYSIAIGTGAGYSGQGNNAIALGTYAGNTNQSANSIIINASSTELNGAASGLYVNPIRNDTSNVSNPLYYNTSTKELTYANNPNQISGEPQIAPVLANLTWFNQGSATATQRAGYISMLSDASTNARFLAQPVPAPSSVWYATMKFDFTAFNGFNSRVGIMLYDSSTGRAQSFDILNNTLELIRWDSLAAPTALIFGPTAISDTTPWMRMTWNGSSASWSVSVDGYSWVLLTINAVTSLPTPTHIGFFVEGGSSITNMAVTSWSVG